MAKLFLQSGVSNIQIVNPMNIYGAAGGESITLTSAARGVVFDQNIEQVNLPGLASAYTYQQTGNKLNIYTGGTLMVTIPVQGDADGSLIRFSDGNIVSANISGGVMTLGRVVVSATAASALTVPASTTTPAGAIIGTLSTSTTKGGLYLDPTDGMISVGNPLIVYGSGGASDTVQIGSGVQGVTCDQSIETVSLTGASSSYSFLQGGNQLKVYSGNILLVTIPVQGDADGTQMVFSDGTCSAALFAGTMKLGAAIVSATTTGTVSGIWSGSAPLVSKAAALSKVDNDIGTLLDASSPIVAGVIFGTSTKWNTTALTYSFPTTIPSEYIGFTSSDGTSPANGWTPSNDAEKAALRNALQLISQITPLTFTETTGSTGTIRMSDNTQTTSAGYAVPPSPGSSLSGDIWLNSAYQSQASAYFTATQYGFTTVIHELGHALGLKHTFEPPTVVPPGTDNSNYSVMTYTHVDYKVPTFTITPPSCDFITKAAYDSAYQIYDIAGLQALYGANMSTRTGNDTYSIAFSEHKYLMLWDAGGNDTINAASAIGACTVNLQPGSLCSIDVHTLAQQKADTLNWYLTQGSKDYDYNTWLTKVYSDPYSADYYTGENNLGIAYGTIIENVTTGSGDDTVRDNSVNNSIFTGAGNDTIILGKGGFDTVDGGQGTDTVQLPTVTGSQVQQERQSDGSLLLVTSGFAVKLIGVESVTCSDGALTLI